MRGKNIILGVTGGVAIHKSLDLVSQLVKRDANVHVVMTNNATKMVQPLQFQVISRQPVLVDLFHLSDNWKPYHIDLSDQADLLAVVPATANIIGKMANGIADDALSTIAISVNCPTLVAPAMNGHMYQHPAMRANMERLKRQLEPQGLKVVEPASGMLACGYEGVGRLNELEVILSAIEDVLMKKPPTGRTDLSGKKVLVTAGPTREYLDPVRFITNRSSGKMGYAIAEVAHQRGAEVTLISGPVSIEVPTGISPIFTQTTNELYQAVMSKMDSVDVIIMAAAVADYQAKTVSNQKIKKSSSVNELTLLLQPTIDIAADLGKKKKKEQILITFAAETENLTENAKLKLKSKNCDLVVANDITDPEAGFDIETNVVTLIDKENSYQLPVMSKKEVAENIFDFIKPKL